eukprot:m51a1_g9464 hypothetical protein (503) ;mRNA; r:530374-541133
MCRRHSSAIDYAGGTVYMPAYMPAYESAPPAPAEPAEKPAKKARRAPAAESPKRELPKRAARTSTAPAGAGAAGKQAAKKVSDGSSGGAQPKAKKPQAKKRAAAVAGAEGHPPYLAMIVRAAREAPGCVASYYAIERSIRDNYGLGDVTDATLRRWVRLTVQRGLESGDLKAAVGHSGSFRATDKGVKFLKKASSSADSDSKPKATPKKSKAKSETKAKAKEGEESKTAKKTKKAAASKKKSKTDEETKKAASKKKKAPAKSKRARDSDDADEKEPARKKAKKAPAKKATSKKAKAPAKKKAAPKKAKSPAKQQKAAEDKAPEAPEAAAAAEAPQEAHADKVMPAEPEVAPDIQLTGVAFNTTDIPAVRDDVRSIIKTLLQDDNTVVGVIANRGAGADVPYVLEKLDFTNEPDKITAFVEGSYGEGSDWLAYYRMVLESAAHLPWANCRSKTLVLVGDNGTEVLRDPSLQMATGKLETLGVKVYGFHHSQLEILQALLTDLH